MLMIVPLMIWSARIEIESQAWRSETSIPVAIAASDPEQDRHGQPEER